MRFIFSLRTIALATLSYGHLPKQLPDPEMVDNIAVQIQDFMETYAWRSFVSPKSMKKTRIKFGKEYKTTINIIKSDPELWSVFSQDCDDQCLNEVKALIQ
jgi:hypothetical protein